MSTAQIKTASGRTVTVSTDSQAYKNYQKGQSGVVSRPSTSSPTANTTQQPQQSYTASTPNYSSSNKNSYNDYSSYSAPSQSNTSIASTNQQSSNNNNTALLAQQRAQQQAQQNKANYDASQINSLASKYGINTGTLNEIKRKADNGIALTGNNAQNAEIYKMYQDMKNQPIEYKPDVNATANFNNNWDDFSGVLINGQQATHAQASGQNPLHVVNTGRQGLIQDAVSSNDWTALNNWEAKQTPYWYDQGADGNYTQNKAYYANLIESDVRAIREAEARGDTFTAGEWTRSLNEKLEKYKNAPGADQYMVGINSDADYARQYGINQAGNDYFDSVWNNNKVRTTGRLEDIYWTQNPVFEDKALLDTVLGQSNSYGSPDEQAQRQMVNQQAMDALAQYGYLNGRAPETAPTVQAPVQSGGGESYIPPEIIEEVLTQPSAPSAPTMQGDRLQHIYMPGASSGVSGYTDNQLIGNEALTRYLQNILKGGF